MEGPTNATYLQIYTRHEFCPGTKNPGPTTRSGSEICQIYVSNIRTRTCEPGCLRK